MNIRKLRIEDAGNMLLWMRDERINRYMATDFSKKTIEDAKEFIRLSTSDSRHIHRAIVNDEDEYQGTVSIKNIDGIEGTGEFAIVVSQKAVGHGYAWYGMRRMLEYAFCELNLNAVYWCVSEMNVRAIRFYEKHGFHKSLDISQSVLDRYDGIDNLRWYSALRGDVIEKRNEIAGCSVINITTYPTLGAGELSVFEGNRDLPFDIKRVYYISKSPEGTHRGYHAHKKLKQVLFCPYGRILIKLKNKCGCEEIELSDPSVGIIIDKPTWREMIWLQKDSVLCIAASDFYDENDYIRDFNHFEKEYM